MDAGQIELPLKLHQHPRLPAFALGQFRTIGDAVLAADDAMRLGSARLHLRQRAHKLGKAAVRLHPTGEKGDDLLHRGNLQPRRLLNRRLRRGVEFHVHPVVHHGQPGAEIVRKLARLIFSGAEAHRAARHVEQEGRVAGRLPKGRVQVVLMRAERHVVGRRVVVPPFEVRDELRIRPDVPRKHA